MRLYAAIGLAGLAALAAYHVPDISACFVIGAAAALIYRQSVMPPGFKWIGWALLVMGLFSLSRLAFGGECDGVRGYWVAAEIDNSESGEHVVGERSIEVRNDTFSPAHAVETLTVTTDASSWGSCAEIPLTVDYELNVVQCDECASCVGVHTFANCNTNPAQTPALVSSSIGTGLHPGEERSVKVQLSGRRVQGNTKATISSGVKEFPIAPPRLSDKEKRQLRNTITAINAVEAATALAASTYALSGSPDDVLVAAVLGFGVATMHGTTTILGLVLANDPWDAKFRRVASAIVEPIPQEIQLGRDWALNMARIKANAQKLYTSINRANTAMAAKAPRAEDRQQEAIADSIQRLAVLFRREANLRERVAKLMTAYPTPVADPALLQTLRTAAEELS